MSTVYFLLTPSNSGWYSQSSVKVGGRTLRMKCSVHLNSTRVSIVSSTLWKQTDGPIVVDDIYIGETYSASKETRGWDMPVRSLSTQRKSFEVFAVMSLD